MADTYIGRADPRAVTIMSVALQTESIRHSKFLQQMSGPTPRQAMALAKREKQQTTAGMPIVQIHDLQKAGGDRITMDMFHIMRGLPAIGDEVIEGRGENMSFSTMDLVINQTRKAATPGGNMTQKRTPHNLRLIARANVADWFARYNDQMCQVHLAGARGTDASIDWIVPLESHARFSEYTINPVLPPTDNRYYLAGGAADVSAMGVTDALTLEDIDVIAADLREQPLPPMPIKVEMDLEDNERPLWCMIMTERQWHYIETKTGKNNWRQLVADASLRYQITKHPLFAGSTAMWNGILLKRMSRPIRFAAGDAVKLTNSTTGGTTSKNVHADVSNVDRALILGGQALAMAWGNKGNPKGPFPMDWSEILMDHGNKIEMAGGQMEGKKKIRYTGTDGKVTDFGCAVIDSYAPDPKTEAGQTLRTALNSK